MPMRVFLFLLLTLPLSAKPVTTYPGREPDAQWRKDALQRIDQIRKSDLTIVVVDRNNNPVPNAHVDIRMIRHAFPFGSCVNENLITNNTSNDAQKYRDTIAKYFNVVVIENGLKWPAWERTPHTKLDAAIQWFHNHNIAVRGHNLVWPSWNKEGGRLPPDTVALKNSPEKLEQRIVDHITKEATDYRGQLVDWDVINEPWSNHEVLDIVGKDKMINWFRAAHKADPLAHLYLNDFIMFPIHPDRRDFEFNTIKYLLDNHAPLEGIGEQAHLWADSANLPSPQEILTQLDRFSSFHLPIRITEFDVDTADEQLQADYLRDFYIATFSHPSVNGILMWGFWERADWKPRAALWRADWSLKPAGKVYVDLLTHQWMTRASATTDSVGQTTVRGFQGDYEITVIQGVQTTKTHATLQQGGSTIRVELP